MLDVSSVALQRKVSEWQKPLLKDYQDGCEIHFKQEAPGLCSAYSVTRRVPGREASYYRHIEFDLLPRVKAIIVGLDIREYSRRSAEAQFFLTLNLHSSIYLAQQLLQKAGLTAPYEPRIVVQTGDGAYVVFTFLSAYDPFVANTIWQERFESDSISIIREETKDDRHRIEEACKSKLAANKLGSERLLLSRVASDAFAFVFALNAILAADGERKKFVVDEAGSEKCNEAMPVFPIECRFALSYDDVLLLMDINDSLNCVGSGMVTCTRILATDKGAHLLVDQKLLEDLEPHGGLTAIGDGVWGQRLHRALMGEVQVKTTRFRYADVFGFYNDGPLLQALGKRPDEPKTYHIGSHDIGSLFNHAHSD